MKKLILVKFLLFLAGCSGLSFDCTTQTIDGCGVGLDDGHSTEAGSPAEGPVGFGGFGEKGGEPSDIGNQAIGK